MEERLNNFSSFLSYFYEDQLRNLQLSLIFQTNANMFEESFEIINELPSNQDMQKMILVSYCANFQQKNFFFNVFKECLICLLSMYEFMHQKSFITFVQFFHSFKSKVSFRQMPIGKT